MPIGSLSVFPRIISSVLSTNPKTILDLGIGFGANGAGIRNWYGLGVWPQPNIHITGIEIFEQYENPVWDLYDEIVIQEIEVFLRLCIEYKKTFDMVIMTDVLEHFPKDKGFEILKLISLVANKAAVVSTPAVFFEQGAAYGNEYERHLSYWMTSDFIHAGWGIVQDEKPDFLGHQMLIADFIK